MKQGIWVAAVGVLAAISTASSSSEALISHTVPAMSGRAWIPANDTCFSTPSFSNSVQNVCGSAQSYLVPLPLTGNHGSSVAVSYRASAAGAGGIPQCRFVVRTHGDLNVLLGGLTNVSGVNTSLGGATVLIGDATQHLDCVLPASSRRLTEFSSLM